MNRAGFTLVELIVVIGIISIILGISTFEFVQYSRKSETEGQTRKLYGDLMEFRSSALFEKRSKAVKFTATTYSLYSTTTTTVAPVDTRTIKRALTRNNSSDIVFDSRGMLPYGATDNQTICVTEENDAAVDSIVVSATRIQLGKREGGAVCNAGNIIFK